MQQHTQHATMLPYDAEGGDLTAGMAVMKGTNDYQVKAPTGANVDIIGFVYKDIKQNQTGTIQVDGGVARAIAAGVVANLDRLRVAGASGKLEKATGLDDKVVAIALSAAGADGDVIFVLPVRSGALSNTVQSGTATLVGGTVTINTATITANSRIFVQRKTLGGAAGHISTPNRTPGAPGSFDITSASGTETSTVDWMVVN